MPAGLSTLAELRRAGIVTSQEVVAAIDAYMRDPTADPYRFASGHSLDIPALVALTISPEQIAHRSGPQEKALRTAVAAVVMAAHPTPP